MKRAKKVVFNDKDLLRFLDESNRIEGIVASEVGWVLALIGHRITNPYIKGMVEALNYVRKNATRPIEERDVFKIHKLIMRNLLEKRNVGAYRKCAVRVGDSICPMPGAIKELMFVWVEHARMGKDPFMLHCAFEKIHPFVDGNGRTGRMIWAWHEILAGREIKPILDRFEDKAPGDFHIKRAHYYAAIKYWEGYYGEVRSDGQ